MKRIYARVEGRVQGVGFRYVTARRALELGLTGWVHNLPGGHVELEAQGAASDVARLVEFLHKGPPAARVDQVHVSAHPVADGEQGFRIL
ncbi:MAG: acylphosphatase [Candidatus Eisenbacteria bacterium]|nr:acylphosphatase [Candidatus Eisenbacteria bacterium]